MAARTGPVSYEVDVGNALWSRHVDQLLTAGPAEEPADRPDGRGGSVGAGGSRAVTGERDAPIDGGGGDGSHAEALLGGICSDSPGDSGGRGCQLGGNDDGSGTEAPLDDDGGGPRRSGRHHSAPRRLIEEMWFVLTCVFWLLFRVFFPLVP